MEDWLLDLLACPDCQGTLARDGETLVCADCGARYPVVRGIPRFVGESEAYYT